MSVHIPAPGSASNARGNCRRKIMAEIYKQFNHFKSDVSWTVCLVMKYKKIDANRM